MIYIIIRDNGHGIKPTNNKVIELVRRCKARG
jgi:hypothetical protein